MGTTIIGIDCSTNPKKVGLAKATLNTDGFLKDWDCEPELKQDKEVMKQLRKWNDDQNCLLALDAPLGWPAEFAGILDAHSAGSPINADKKLLFSRETDRFIEGKFGKPPLSVHPFRVGADKIAATAYSALDLLAKLGGAAPLPLAWQPGEIGATCAVEVYPSATLASYGWTYTDRIMPLQEKRKKLAFGHTFALPDKCISDKHVFDAIVCVLAGHDFLKSSVYGPEDCNVPLQTAHKEGWIWVKKPE